MRFLRTFAAAAVAGLAAAAPLAAQDDYGRGGFEVSGYGGVLNTIAAEFGDEEAGIPAPFQVDNDPLVGGRLAYVFPNNFFIEGDFAYLPTQLRQGAGGEMDIDNLRYGGAIGYNFQVDKNFQLFILGGAGASTWDVDGLDSETDLNIQWGGGVKVFLARNFLFRFDIRNHIAPEGLNEIRDQLTGSVGEEETTSDVEFSAGLGLFFGGPKDSDGDGVPDERDACPDTPRGVAVDARGCPPDSDMDGVADYLDECPDTPRGARVDAKGCPTDADGDGVFDGIDQCPDTPRGATVDARGCPSDADGDGVFDGIDQCPDTPRGATVDARGCPMDGDGDGVFDGIDQCPNTPAGARVDERGCTVVEAEIRRGRLSLANIHFEFDSSELKADSRTILDEVAQAIVSNVNLEVARLEVQGHTDSVGSDAYNQALSQRRAQAVLSYLLETEPRLRTFQERAIAAGFGESQPVASNDTDEGRAQNRRVEFVITNNP